MGKMKTEEDGATAKVKSTGKDATKDGKKEKLSTELKKRAQKDLLAAHAVEQAEKVALKDERDFLNTVCNEIIHLHDLKLHTYRGKFDDFETGSGTPHLQGGEQKEKVKDRAKSIAAKEASKNKAKGKVDEDETPAEAPKKWRDYSVEFHFPEPTELTPPFLQLVEVSFSYPQREDFKLSGDLVPSEGEVQRSQKLRIGRYSQHFVDLLTMDETPVQYLLHLHPDQGGLCKQGVRAKLGKYTP
ncbi:PREDICTED: ABC transporter [Prunus dulcis]|uniref:PREDICTED: ABC transporter n=1 Tax=Prunus dulcis TaxID=3755 RepID=A0A5E4G1D2_PRUDU|nr:hypothetical protein L3X38_009927 [Prunus dulcis]VVA33557.1 PREDICTED: ABC transporter [Prunus dulcis]